MNIVPMLFYILLFVAIFYFLAVRPQRRQKAQHAEMMRAMKKGDEIVTVGGLYGTVRKIGDDWVEVEIAPRTRVRFLKRAISTITTIPEEDEYEEEEYEDAQSAGELEAGEEEYAADDEYAEDEVYAEGGEYDEADEYAEGEEYDEEEPSADGGEAAEEQPAAEAQEAEQEPAGEQPATRAQRAGSRSSKRHK